MTRRYVELVLRYRVAVLLGCAAITVASAWMIAQGHVASSLVKLFFGESAEYDAYRKLSDRFGDNDVVVVAVDVPDLFSGAEMGRLDRVVARIEAQPEVKRARSVAQEQRVRGFDDELVIETYKDVVKRAPDSGAGVREEILRDDLLAGLLVSRDGGGAAVLVELRPDKERPVELLPGILDGITGAFAAEGFEQSRLHLAGLIPESVETTSQAQFNILRVFPVTVLVLIVVVYLLFLQLWPVAITTGIALVANIWTFGFAVLVDRQINLMLAMVPAVMMVVSLSDIIHLCSAYINELRAGLPKMQAVVKSAAEVGVACFYTSATTLIGFASLAFVPTPVFRQLGVVLGVGVALALVLAMTLVPIALSLIPEPKVGLGTADSRAARWVDALAVWCHRVGVARAKTVVGVFVIVFVVTLWGSYQIRVETNLPNRLSPHNPIRVAQTFIQERFAGSNFIDLYLEANTGDWLDPARLHRVAALQAELARLPDISKVISLVDLIERLHGAMRPVGPAQALPDSRELLAQYLLLFEMSGGEGLERFVDEEHRLLRLTLWLPHTNLVETSERGNAVALLARQAFGDDVTVTVTGMPHLFGSWVQFIVDGQRRGLVFALISTTLMMMLALGRAWGGVMSMLPNVFPIIVLGGVLGLTMDRVDSDTMLIAMIAIGIAVDDTIHFLTRLRLEYAQTREIDSAMRNTFAFAGRGMVLTTVILCLGFLPFAASDYYTTHIMGTLLPFTLLVALAADLLLVPAMVKLGAFRLERS